MRPPKRFPLLLAGFLSAAAIFNQTCSVEQASPAADNRALVEKIATIHGLSPNQHQKIRTIFLQSQWIGQGNPAVTRHPVTGLACTEQLKRLQLSYENSKFERICGAKYMAPLYAPEKSKPDAATACIDMFEFPDIPCEYPVVWVRVDEAVKLCEAMGKRLCDAHEWEGACAGTLQDPDYRFDLAIGVSPPMAIERMRKAHNQKYIGSRSWSYGAHYQKGVCATSSFKSPGCDGSSYARCGSNTFPSGYFPECKSALQVFDLHGNAAEQMNLPLNASQLASAGRSSMGYSEMKGSWFIFDTNYAHQDWCRWRAPFWHGTRVISNRSHRNYHLGFRCCKSVGENPGKLEH